MINKRQISQNIIFTLLDTLISTFILFYLYRYIINHLGAEKLGVWSLVLATASITNISEFGLSGSVVKYVAKYMALNKNDEAAKVVQTGILSLGGVIGFFLIIVYYPLIYALQFFVPEVSYSEAKMLLPYALFSIWMTIVTGVVQSGLDGYMRTDIRRIVMLLSNALYLVLSISLIKECGIAGLAYSQIIQQIFIIIVSWILLFRTIPELPIIPCRWSKELFKEMVGYGANFQLISLVVMLVEPLTKMLLSRYGGLLNLAYYEMCNKLIMKFRSILINVNQVLIPVYATLQEIDVRNIVLIYKNNTRLTVYLSIIGYSAISTFSVIISVVWIGHKEPFFISALLLSCVTWFVNTINAPAYFAFMGVGDLKWNLASHIVMGLLTCLLGFLFGSLAGGYGVITGRLLASLFGSLIVVLAFHRINKISIGFFWRYDDTKLLILSLITICAGVSLFFFNTGYIITTSLVVLMIILVIWSLFCIDSGRELFAWVVRIINN